MAGSTSRRHRSWINLLSLLCCIYGSLQAPLAAQTSEKEQVASESRTAESVARWDFGTEDTSNAVLHGLVERDQPGPRPPQYPDFEANNTAIRLPGDGSHLKIADPGKSSIYDFDQGDAITLEAWIKVTDLEAHEHHVIIGKGRTNNKGYPADNQNWALRIRQQRGKGYVNFLFATAHKENGAANENKEERWHRWTSKEGFDAGTGWHHVAVAYRFGEPESIRGWLDGKSISGNWDMGGPTKLGPVVDDDEVWIGASQGALAANSFVGYLDAIAIHRGIVSDELMSSRYRREGPAVIAAPEVMPDVGPVEGGKIRLTLHEKVKSHQRWLIEDEKMPTSSLEYSELDAFFLQRLPLAWDAWGIRDHWGTPVVARLAADVRLPAGKHKLLLRARGLTRLWENGNLLARTGPLTGSPSGEEPMTPLPELARDGIRWPGYRQQEMMVEWPVELPGVHRVILETMVGGKGHRPDTGELLVAVELEGTDQFRLLSPDPVDGVVVPLTDAEVEPFAQETEGAMRQFDIERRRALAKSQESYWAERHGLARELATAKIAELLKNARIEAQEQVSVDYWIERRVADFKSLSQSVNVTEAAEFQRTIGKLLQDQCVRCHGERSLGGLQLNDRESLLLGGNSGVPGVTPGDVSESEIWRRVTSNDVVERMPPHGDGLKAEQLAAIKSWIENGAKWPATAVDAERLEYTPILDDASFLRKVTLDTLGLPPSEAEVRSFLEDTTSDKRARTIERLLADKRWADHELPYWQDVLAENPTLINASLNSTGPFRWFLYDAFYDDKSVDRWVTELMMMRGNPHTGGSAGFAIAAENDAPFATKAQILASAFLGIELQCARCHDSPYHSSTQKDLFSLASMLERKGGVVPKTSRVPAAFFEKQERAALIKATLKPDEVVEPSWPFEDLLSASQISNDKMYLQCQDDSRAKLAYWITNPQNERFAQVVVNRIWRRLIGVGIVEPPHDWEGNRPSDPELLQWLAWEFVAHGYDAKHIERLILNSRLYQRVSRPRYADDKPATRLFTAPTERRLTAEQVLDSMLAASGSPLDVEELTFDPDGRRAADNRISLGIPTRAWMFPSLANERDRPSLNLPKAQAVVTVLESFGWIGARQAPRTDRELDPNVLQPGVLANGIVSSWVTRAAQDSELAQLAIEAQSAEGLVESLYLRFLSRRPYARESERYVDLLKAGFEQRLVPVEHQTPSETLVPLRRVTWSNHLVPEATTIMLELERRARMGPPVEPKLESQWREAYEDVVWCLLNSTEFVWLP